jgi:Domain of unknown function (DUF4338)
MSVSTPVRYRGRVITDEEVNFISGMIANNPRWSRRRLSAELCRAWNWVQPNGALRDMVCRSLLLVLHRGGLIELPAKKKSPPNNVVARPAAPSASVPLESRPMHGSLSSLGPLEIRQVRRTSDEALFEQLMTAHHYLGYTQPVGEHLKYVVWAQGEPIACLAWSSAPRHLAARDRFIGWPAAVRKPRLHLIAYNTRFLIVPSVVVPHLASHLLGVMARRISADWQAVYAHPIHLLETFVDPARFQGTCYRAANWQCLGPTKQCHQPRKELWVYPLSADFRRRLHPSA